MTIQVGSIQLSSPVILAPMSGITDAPFRRIVREFGVGMAVSEMVAGNQNLSQERKSVERTRRAAGEKPFVVQLAGCEPALMSEAAKYNADQGADIIDINMGCPVKKVVNGIGGSALMRDEKLAARIIEATVSAVSVPVTLKMRTGWDDDNRNAPNLARIAQDIGIQLVTVHGRTRQQFYNGRADWDFIAEVKDAVDIPVIANGDVRTVDDAKSLLQRSTADGVMIGRGANGRPWFPSQVSTYLADGRRLDNPGLATECKTLLRHYDDLLSYYGIRRGVRIARKHIGWYMAGAGIPKEQYGPVQRMNEPADVVLAIRGLYAAQEKLMAAA
jgi:tRNA-dihydrouridine synthase B